MDSSGGGIIDHQRAFAIGVLGAVPRKGKDKRSSG